jgi:hypothetical protein
VILSFVRAKLPLLKISFMEIKELLEQRHQFRRASCRKNLPLFSQAPKACKKLHAASTQHEVGIFTDKLD